MSARAAAMEYKPGMLGRGSSEHLRGNLGGTKLYTHSAFSISGSGAQAAERRQAKWAAGADHVKQAISQQYGDGVGEQVFKKILGNTGRDLNKERGAATSAGSSPRLPRW
jgi:hypothetical protein